MDRTAKMEHGKQNQSYHVNEHKKLCQKETVVKSYLAFCLGSFHEKTKSEILLIELVVVTQPSKSNHHPGERAIKLCPVSPS